MRAAQSIGPALQGRRHQGHSVFSCLVSNEISTETFLDLQTFFFNLQDAGLAVSVVLYAERLFASLDVENLWPHSDGVLFLCN